MNHLALKEKFKEFYFGNNFDFNNVGDIEFRNKEENLQFDRIFNFFTFEITAREERLVEEIEKLPKGGNLIDIEQGEKVEAVYKWQVIELIQHHE